MSALSILSKNELLGNRVTFRAIVVASLQILVFVQLLNSTGAHVGLTFPPARRYDLDFLDKIRTKAPCGMPKGTLKTSLISGSKFNVTWHLSYPHRVSFST
ncbi:unnamed protein product [Allacma fusca]|uniref:Uncharacterized protein n=1 Tax=Allacma fusca TaxID=39272 RepID=A0A8J2KSL0_9HEXA|nr:unnamed protein product [Allacma fusca]